MSDTAVNPDDPDDHTYRLKGSVRSGKLYVVCACGWTSPPAYGFQRQMYLAEYNAHLTGVVLDTLGIHHGPDESEQEP